MEKTLIRVYARNMLSSETGICGIRAISFLDLIADYKRKPRQGSRLADKQGGDKTISLAYFDPD